MKAVFLHLALVIFSPSAWAENTALNDVLRERSNIISEAEQNSESLKTLNIEKRQLIDRLVEVNKQYDEIMQVQTQQQQRPTPVAISLSEINNFIGRKRMGRCQISPGEYLGEYIIQKEKVKIRFAFLPANSRLAPKLSIVSGATVEGQVSEVFQIEQPGYDPSATNLEGDMQAMLRFSIRANNTPGEFTHAVFHGQKIHDQWFGQRSSLRPAPVTCVLGSELN